MIFFHGRRWIEFINAGRVFRVIAAARDGSISR
jgi:hypothetical protein